MRSCFPHCCPEHIDRSYCGTSLSVCVELEHRPPDTSITRTVPPSDAVAIFARFEAVSDISLRPGECVDVTRIAAGTQSERNLGGQWVAGTLERPSRLVTTIRTPGAPPDEQKPLVFHLNGRPFSHWCYDWESGANKTQRRMKHVLKAYIFERCAFDKDGNFTASTGRHAHTQLYRVLHVVTSLEFTVMSYRRTPMEQSHAALDSTRRMGIQASEGLAFTETTRQPARNLDRAHSPNLCAPGSTSTHSQPATVKSELAYSEARKDKRQRISFYSAPPDHPTESSAVLDDKLRWAYTNSTSLSVSSDLALVYAFMRWTPLCAYASFVDEAVRLVHQSVEESASSETSKLNCFSRLLFAQAGSSGGTTFFVGEDNTSMDLPKELETLLRALSQATQWWFSADTRQWVRAFFRQYAGSVLDKHAMRACFVLLVQELQTGLDTQVFARTELHTLANAAEEVIAAVYAYPYFRARRLQVREILSGHNVAGWTAFVAQMRETYIGMSAEPRVPRALANNRPSMNFARAHPPQNFIERDWNAEWLMGVDEARWKFSDQAMKADRGDGDATNSAIGDAKRVFSLLNVFEIISQMVRLEVAIDVQACTLHIRSTQSISNPLGCMRVVLDGKERVFSQFPNGMASATEAYGNYIGEMRVERPERLVVYLQFFNWPAAEGGPSYNIRTRIDCWRARRLCISGDVLVPATPENFAPEETSSLGEMSLRSKRGAVAKAHVRRQRIYKNATVSNFEELGRFRLSYIKV
ncbi:hypothetical protein PHYPSEUDO_015341 [Phytophthora pseudosyringae]|uniref:Uncharacterized protein n=1 Tax=Phytophthora pseudosyringae TaxID=221518 RepID=A0A8T1V653_9STRA|nr:hypothetical protein PHYPSEUDO_015341 [Phytophthora pseudosyringae]